MGSVPAAKLAFQNNEVVAMLVPQSNTWDLNYFRMFELDC